jgi:hypothetical protein
MSSTNERCITATYQACSLYQATVWEQACSQGSLDLADPTMYCWQKWTSNPSQLMPVLTTKDSVPKECLDIVIWKCKKDMCKSRLCKCRRANMQCCRDCECHNHGTCVNMKWTTKAFYVRILLIGFIMTCVHPDNHIYSTEMVCEVSIEAEIWFHKC